MLIKQERNLKIVKHPLSFHPRSNSSSHNSLSYQRVTPKLMQIRFRFTWCATHMMMWDGNFHPNFIFLKEWSKLSLLLSEHCLKILKEGSRRQRCTFLSVGGIYRIRRLKKMSKN
jgi:hypothetical protein